MVALTGCQTTKIEPIPGDTIGMVLMHGKGGSQRSIAGLASSLKSAGILVETPLMPWGKNRIYDKSYDEAMDEIDVHVALLKKTGAKRIVIAGHSLGANAALGYAARRQGISGVILLAYGHVPGKPGFGVRLAKSVDKAQAMIKSGNGESSASFTDFNQGKTSFVTGTANDILSWFDPNGPATIRHNAPKVKSGTPVLCIYGKYEKFTRCTDITWEIPVNSRNRTIEVKANHGNTPRASIEQVGKWLREL
jgi:pimeloyl-ACP methyl ester carboxylesterase